jgi:redox-sensitive bicupin YhaK (pirin superfamily)
MSAGSGIRHSEFNASKTDPVHLLQIWIVPETKGLKPSYEQRTFSELDKRGTLRLIGSHDGRDGSVTIHQDIDLYAAVLPPGTSVSHDLDKGRQAWVQVARGSVAVNGMALNAGDGLAASDSGVLAIEGDGEVLLFDMAA